LTLGVQDDYLVEPVRALTSGESVASFLWRRVLEDTPNAVATLRAQVLALVREQARLGEASGSPATLSIEAHSWGGVLAFLALRDLQEEAEFTSQTRFVSVRLDTMGSPVGCLDSKTRDERSLVDQTWLGAAFQRAGIWQVPPTAAGIGLTRLRGQPITAALDPSRVSWRNYLITADRVACRVTSLGSSGNRVLPGSEHSDYFQTAANLKTILANDAATGDSGLSSPSDDRCSGVFDFTMPNMARPYSNGEERKFFSGSVTLRPDCWSAWATVESDRTWWIGGLTSSQTPSGHRVEPYEVEFKEDGFRTEVRPTSWVGFVPPGRPVPSGYGSLGWHGRTFRVRGAEGSLMVTVEQSQAEQGQDLAFQRRLLDQSTTGGYPQCAGSTNSVLEPRTVTEKRLSVKPGCTTGWILMAGFNKFRLESTVPVFLLFDAGRHPEGPMQSASYIVTSTVPFCLRSAGGDGEAVIRVVY
jgi:hypothetical protein